MTTDFQQFRVSLGARLRELRGPVSGRVFAERLGWLQSKLETGRQTGDRRGPSGVGGGGLISRFPRIMENRRGL